MLIHLCARSVSAVVDTSTGVPTIHYWGPSLGDDPDLTLVADAATRPLVHGALDVVPPCSLVPEHGSGWAGRPGLEGSRGEGSGWAARFTEHDVPLVSTTSVTVDAVAAPDALTMRSIVSLDPASGALTARLTVTNIASVPYRLDRLSVTVPLPGHATELLTFEGRWTRELHERRTPWIVGSQVQENRRGRTSHERPPLVYAGEQGFGEWHGQVWGLHLAWSGNHDLVAEHLAEGDRYVQMGELLHPGEVVLGPGESYSTPEVIGVHGDGLTAATQMLHRHLRSRPGHPGPDRPRPVLLNTWEAVYFDHDTERLCRLADAAAAVGVERFVLDDGWFGGRRHDRAGLGDWWVSPEVYPEGLGPLITHVRSLGMEFGIWVEPEMVNPDSDLYRAHPDWVLVAPGYDPVLGRHQLVLDLAHPDAFAEILARLDALLTDHDISYVKWDMNRDHVHAADQGGRAGTHAQTKALYRLLDVLNERHPQVEIESCSSGGGRIDAEILRRTRRVWTSDCNDAVERVRIQRGASMLIPPEVMGAHIGPTRSHTTARSHPLAFRAATALFGHLGIEWNLLELTDAELASLGDVVSLHRQHRALLHSGDVVRFDRPDDSSMAHGVYRHDRGEAIVSFTQLRTAPSLVPAPLRLPGLDPTTRYRVRPLPLPGLRLGAGRGVPAWWADGATISGLQLASHGLALPALHPESAVVLHLVAEP